MRPRSRSVNASLSRRGGDTSSSEVRRAIGRAHGGQAHQRAHEAPKRVMVAIVNKVVVHMDGMDDVTAWLRQAIEVDGLRNFILVGGSSSRVVYPGPDVVSANEGLRWLARGREDIVCGNITIPERQREVERLLRKTRSGARFFTSQVLFEPEPISTVLSEYGEACAAEGLLPATVLLSFAPVADYEDVEFLVWLGATITPETEEALLAHSWRGVGA